jgi:arabinan endo-1,5-alpha-L-arabinosidase
MFATPATRRWSSLAALLLALSLLVVPGTQDPVVAQAVATETYTNPILPDIPGDGVVESCADPSVLRGQTSGDNYWYMFCTTDPLNDEDRVDGGGFNFRLIPMLRSLDLVNWEYVGDAFDRPGAGARPERVMPAWAEPTAGMWAPEIQFFNGRYYLYYGVTDVKDGFGGEPGCNSDNAIGVATSLSPTGPWVDSGQPLIGPRRGGPGCNFLWTYDPDVLVNEANQKYIYYGSYYGGVFVQELAADGLATTTAAPVQVTIANRYEGPEVVHYNDYYYLFVSAADCCRGPLTGYSVFAGRSTSPLGPFVDREGVSLLRGRVGGTPVISMNGNRWVGPGHNSVFQDWSGQWWTAYHAIDRFDPYFEGAVGFTKRPVLLDPIDWIDGWPTVRAGRWASDEPMPAPAAQPDDESAYVPSPAMPDERGGLQPAYSDEFGGNELSDDWSWVREPAAGGYEISNGVFSFDTQAADLFVDSNSASVLTRPAPAGDYLVETKVTLDLPPEGCCYNYVQAGLVIYGDDDNFLKLVHFSNWETRQTEFAKEMSPVPAGYPRYGNTVVGPPALTTWLRIVKRAGDTEDHYTAYTSRDGRNWVRGGTWTHNLGDEAKIGLVAMGGTGFTAEFDYVRVSHLRTMLYLPIVFR